MIDRLKSSALGLVPAAALSAALGTLAFAPAPAAAQDIDARWLPWMGCWEETGRTVPANEDRPLVCFRPAEDGGVEAVSLSGTEVVETQWMTADGEAYDTPLEGCEGWERLTFSDRPGRVFLQSEHVCEGGIERESSGVISMVAYDEWIDARVLAVGEEKSVWVTRYRAAGRAATEAAGFEDVADGRRSAIEATRVSAAARPTVEEVVEALEYADEDAVSAWIIERDARLAVDSDRLVQLADAGVPETVIDVILAVSFPDRFQVDRETEQLRQYAGGSWAGPAPWGYYDPFYGSLFYSPYRYGYGFNRYGYGGYYGRPIVITVGRTDGSSGRVVNGQGYTRGQATPSSQGRTPTRGGAVSRGSSGSSGSVRGSSGSTGRSTGRTARRRGGGDL